jgi:hypothetical protein
LLVYYARGDRKGGGAERWHLPPRNVRIEI